MTDFADIKKRASLPTDTVALCVAGELVDRLARLEAQLAAVKPATSLGDGGERRAIAEQIVALQEEMRDSTVEFHLRALDSRAWAAFWAGWPVRKDGETAAAWNSRVWPAFLELVSRTCVDPVLTTEEADELAGLLHGSAWNRLVNAALALNMGDIDVPNSDAASALIATSEQT